MYLAGHLFFICRVEREYEIDLRWLDSPQSGTREMLWIEFPELVAVQADASAVQNNLF